MSVTKENAKAMKDIEKNVKKISSSLTKTSTDFEDVMSLAMKSVREYFTKTKTNVERHIGEIKIYREYLARIDAHIYNFEWDPIK